MPWLAARLAGAMGALLSIAGRRIVRASPRRAFVAATYALLLVSCDSPFAPDDQTVARIESNPVSLTMTVGDSRTITVRVLDEGGKTLDARPVYWSSQNPAIATVSPAGLVTAVAQGTTQIAASAGGKSTIIPATVNARPVSLVRVTPSTATIVAGTTTPLTAEALDAGGATVTGRPVLWGTSNPSIATVTSTGVITGVSAGTANITATIDGVAGTSVVTVQPVPVTSVTVTPSSGSLIIGQSLQLTATPRDAGDNALIGRAIAWSSNAPTIASVSSTGLVTGLSVGTATITATTEGRSATARLTVSLVPVDTVSVTPRTATIAAGQTQQLSVRIVDSAGNVLAGRDVAWDTDQPTIASVSSSGLVTALSSGRATITATSGSRSGSASITVTPVPVASLAILPASGTLTVGGTLQLTATARDASGNILPGRSITWISGAPSVATVTQGGLVTAVGTGSALIFAASEGVSASISVTVSSVSVAQVRLTPSGGSIAQGRTLQLTATPLDGSGNPISGRTVTWNSSAPSVASVSSTGLVTGIAPGSATVVATIDGVSSSASVTVTPVPVATVVLVPNTTILSVGNSLALTLIVTDSSGTPLSTVGRTVTWLSAQPAIASVNNSGVVSALAPGSASIQAVVDGVSGNAVVTVTNIPVATVTVSPATASLNVGATQQLAATPKDASGNTLTGRATTWSTSNASVATVGSTTGLVTAVGVGSATITATIDGVQGTSSVVVSAVPVASVTVTPSSTSVTEGGSTTLTATALDGSGNVLTGRTIVWSSSNNALAAVSQSGVVTAIAPTPSGSPVTITATATGAGVGGSSPAGASTITVDYAAVTSITLSPSPVAVPKGGTRNVSATLFAGSTPLPASGRTVTWITADATIATVSASGVVTGVAAGTTTLTVTASSPGQATPATQTATITVSPLPVARVKFDPFTGTLHNGTLYRRSVRVTTSDSTGTVLPGQLVVWSVPAAFSSFLALDSAATTSGVTTIVATNGPVSGLQLVASASTGTGTVSDTLRFDSDLVPVGTVSVTPTSATLVGAPQATQVALTATALDSAGNTIGTASGNPLGGRIPSWLSSNPAVATVGATTGQVTGVAAGTSNITATIGGTVSTTPAVITVLAPVTSVALALTSDSVITGNATLGTTAGTVAVLNGSTPLPGRAVTIATGSAAIATVSPATATTDANGEVAVVVTGVSGGNTTVTATATGSGVSSPAVTVRVLRPVATIAIAATPAGQDSVIGTASLPLTATVRDVATGLLAGRVCTVASANSAVATVSATGGTTDASGQLAFTATGVAASATPVAITVGCEGITANFALRVLAPVASVTVTSPTAADSVIGTGTLQLQATLRDAASNILTGRPVTWAVAAASPAGAATVSTTGLVSGVAPGTADITASAGAVTSAPFVTRILPAVSSVTLTAPDSSLILNDVVATTVVLRDAAGATITGRPVTYASSATSVITISATGVMTAVGAGKADITASSEGRTSAAMPVTVSLVPVATVTVSSTQPPNVYPTNAFPATVVARDAANNVLSLAGRTVVWSSSNPAVATVAAGTTAGSATITAVSVGSATISATVDGIGATTPIAVTVKPVPVSTVTVTPNPASVQVGSTQAFTATARDSAGGVLTGRTFTWSSSNAGKATIDATTGVATGVDSTGTTPITITATATGQGVNGTSPSGQAALGVTLVPIGTVVITPSNATVTAPNGTTTLTVETRQANQTPLAGRACTISFTRSNMISVAPTSGTTNGSGQLLLTVTGIATGSGSSPTVSASCEGVASNTATIVVQ